MNCFLGLDLSLTNSGLVVIDKNDKVLTIENIKTIPTKQDMKSRFERYKYISSTVINLCKEYQSIKCISIENYSYGSKGRIVQLTESGTLVRRELIDSFPNSLFIEVAPISLKKFILGKVKKGTNTKALILKEIYKKYKLDFIDDNKADAFILSLIAKNYYLMNNEVEANMFQYQVEVIQNLIKKYK